MIEIGNLLAAKFPSDVTMSQLNEKLLPIVVEKMNHVANRRLWALYGGERIPENESNLTDTRGRVSLLIEHTLVDVINSLLIESGEENLFLSNVVANRFPDLEVRYPDGSLGLRFEVKALQATAEEKSANFSTLKKDIRPHTDYVVVFVWEWNEPERGSKFDWDRAPKILAAFALHASSLAKMRDDTWLGAPPPSIGNGVQGFDLLQAITSSQGRYKAEEGNLGKLMRVFDKSDPVPVGVSAVFELTVNAFKALEEFVIFAGFERLCELVAASSGVAITSRTGVPLNIALTSSGVGFGLSRRLGEKKRIREAMETLSISRLVYFRDKYQWVIYELEADELKQVRSGLKPKELIKNPL
jgi:hypothetical protein